MVAFGVIMRSELVRIMALVRQVLDKLGLVGIFPENLINNYAESSQNRYPAIRKIRD